MRIGDTDLLHLHIELRIPTMSEYITDRQNMIVPLIVLPDISHGQIYSQKDFLWTASFIQNRQNICGTTITTILCQHNQLIVWFHCREG